MARPAAAGTTSQPFQFGFRGRCIGARFLMPHMDPFDLAIPSYSIIQLI
jgi:hypothetical protein